MAKKAERVRLL